MRLYQQYEELMKLKGKIDAVLQTANHTMLAGLFQELDRNPMYRKLVVKDTQLYMLSHFIYVFFREKQELLGRGIDANIFEGVTSLEKLEEKYHTIEFAALRFDAELPILLCEEAINNLINQDISGIAICRIIQFETASKIKNMEAVVGCLKGCEEYVRAITMLQEAAIQWPDEDKILFLLTDLWLDMECYDEAYACLRKVKEPNSEVCQIIEELEKVVNV